METRETKTFVYIDVSNIRSACQRSCEFNIDFIKLYNYFKNKYPNLQDIRYYEGVAKGDKKKQKHFNYLRNKIGYTVCSLARKSYIDPAQYKTFKCQKCGLENKIQTLPEKVSLKSNVDVYLATDMLLCAIKNQGPIHIILVSCDGDYAEAIKAVLKVNSKAKVTIMATPATRKNNCLSSRLQTLANHKTKSTTLVNINSIRDRISQPITKE